MDVKDRATRIFHDGRHGRVEMWSARSRDGAWFFDRLELPGTPWQATYRHAEGWSAWFGSLSKARAGAERQLGYDIALAVLRLWRSRP